MPRGAWDITNKRELAGIYNRFKTVAQNTLTLGTAGVAVLVSRGNWGDCSETIEIEELADVASKLGDSTSNAYKYATLLMKGKPKKLLVVRVADGDQACGTANITYGETNTISLTTKYPSARRFNFTLAPNVADATKVDFTLYEGDSTVVKIGEQKGIAPDSDTLTNTINRYFSDYIVAEKLETATGISDDELTITAVSNTYLTGGNDGVSEISNEDYLSALDKLSGYKFNTFCLDNISTTALLSSVATWVDEMKQDGVDIQAFFGVADSLTVNEMIAQAKTYDSININLLSNGFYIDDVAYNAPECAIYLAGLCAGQGIKECLCYAKTIGTKVTRKFTETEIVKLNKGGLLAFIEEDDEVILVDDRNTLTTYTDEQNEIMGYIRAVRFINIINQDTILNNRKYIGKLANSANGQMIILCALKKYFEVLQEADIIGEDFEVLADEELMATAKNDEFYWKWAATYINVMKKIYGTGYIQ